MTQKPKGFTTSELINLPTMEEKLTQCLNCQAALPNLENYCPNCGQKNHATRLGIRAFFEEIIESVFSFDARIWLTLKTAFLKVGHLAKEFNQGKRKKYVSPVQFYLFCSLIYFLVLGIIAKLDGQMQDKIVEKEIEALEKLEKNDTIRFRYGLGPFNFQENINLTLQEIQNIPTYSNQKIDSILVREGISQKFYNRLLFKHSIRNAFRERVAQRQQMVSVVSAGMFLLIPFLGWLFYLFFSRTYTFYIEHLVFVIYLQSIIFLINAFKNLSRFSDLFGFVKIFNWAAIITYIGVTIYVIIALKQFYQKSWLKTIGYFLLLSALYAIVLVLFLMVILTITLILS